ncbi:efflux RND transporter permease subunit [Numidum massiliense]|uniref:efflux RND transporter permease subunit n=1 Tax=Numidum massiliense TaxID=1522315 RepID=UPI0006D564A5|nr:efflux RND transporter permease subunit [Numidum massiliense]
MKGITTWSFRNRAAIVVSVLLVLCLGVLSYFTLPMEFLPEADNPQITIATLGQGYDADSMVQAVTEPLEQAVAGVKGKRDVFSQTGDGYSQVNIFFASDTDMKAATQEVKDALSALTFPEGIAKPHVVQLNTSMIPVAQVSLAFNDGITKENIKKVEKEILPQFQSVKGAAQVAVYGKTDPRVVIRLDKDKMAKYQLPLQSVMGVLEGQNFAVAVGEKPMDGQTTNLKVISNLDDLDALKNLTLPLPGGATGEANSASAAPPTVRLKDVATIDTSVAQESTTRINGKESLLLVVTKDSTSSAVSVADEVQHKVEKLNKEHTDVRGEVVFATSDMIVDSVNTMLREVLLGALFATVVIMVFLRNVRSTLITIISIPLSLGLTLLLLWLSGVTLNILTLGGVAVAIGRLVDDSIVVVENIFRRMQAKTLSKEDVIAATGEVGKAITSSTLTTVAVFLPLGLISGSLRSFILPFALTVTYSLLTSLIVALTVVPLMSNSLLKRAKLPRHKQPKRYVRVLRWSLNHKFVPIALSVVVLVGSVVLYAAMPKGAVDAEDATMVSATMTFPSDTPLEKVKQKGLALEKQILQMKGHEHVIMQQGNSADAAAWGQVNNPTEVEFTVVMKEGADAEKTVTAINALKKQYPDADITASTASMMGGANGSVVTFDIVGGDEKALDDAANRLTAALKTVTGVKKVSSNVEEKKPVYAIVVDTAKGNTQQTAMQLRGLLNETPLGTVRLDGNDTPVYVDANIEPKSEKDLKKLSLVTEKGIVPLSSVAKVEKEKRSSTVLHKDGKSYVRVSAEVDPQQLSVVSAAMDEKVKQVNLPKGVTVQTGGASDQQASEFADLGLTMLASIGIVYLIMVITFKSLRTPIAILMTLPLASIGAVLGLLVTQVPVDPTAMLGALMLIGIVVTNAIVLIDRVKQNEERMTIREAILEGAATRLRPILMTAIATICAMLPLLFGHSADGSLVSQGLAVVVIGGLTVATVLTLVIVPVFYELLYFRKSKEQRLKALRTGGRAEGTTVA